MSNSPQRSLCGYNYVLCPFRNCGQCQPIHPSFKDCRIFRMKGMFSGITSAVFTPTRRQRLDGIERLAYKINCFSGAVAHSPLASKVRLVWKSQIVTLCFMKSTACSVSRSARDITVTLNWCLLRDIVWILITRGDAHSGYLPMISNGDCVAVSRYTTSLRRSNVVSDKDELWRYGHTYIW